MKKFILGLFCGFLLINSYNAANAEAFGKLLEVFYSIKLIKINGKSLEGAADKLFIYDGTTYVPLRALSEALSYTVNWDEKEEAIILSSKDNCSGIPNSSGSFSDLRQLCINNKIVNIFVFLGV